jgi:hypothetical protein
MDRTLILLLIALAIVYLAWRSARRQNQRLRATREQQIEQRTSTLEPHDDAHSRGFVVLLPDGTRSDEYEVRWEQDALDIVSVDDFPATPEASSAAEFDPGEAVELIPDEEDERSIWVWDRGMTMRAGRVPQDMVAALRARDDRGEIGECIVLRELLDAGRRTGLELLVIHRDMPLEG